MGKFDGVLLVSDFDDTLYGANRRIPPRNLEALHYFVSQGGRFTVATGRAHRTFAPSNCAQEVRDWGAQILCSCDEGVMGDIVEILDKRYK